MNDSLAVFILTEGLNHNALYNDFHKTLSDSTGTILIHHGKAKYPGKQLPDYSKIKLYTLKPDAEEILNQKAKEIAVKHNLNRLLGVHNIGIIDKNDSILFLAVEGKDRETAFNGMREFLEIIKDETILGLKEIK
ncbi:molybdenum cofactor biosynthesis protein MoaE [Spirochaeta isovalerica]|uniref:Molybdopterin synthase catalytic subunit n=1 Tax=Spirochaeta isovalerica TaxID=150 RepID=A0A841R6E5_9SPIO|nr:molybdenum cofactor biosynthesis protein MoaE [Spirochaeta isovalerica]MBB6479425.1 molybdopterin synthase catalytic subunit [Spirochaeta isovalerica]